MFFKGSRYEQVPNKEYVAADGRIIRFRALRAISTPPGIAKHVVDDGERMDHIAFDEFRDPELFWRICDANLAVEPKDLTDLPGRVLDIPEAR
jgi:hypothetical protein